MKNTKSISRSLVLAFSGWELSWGGIVDNRKGEWWLLGQLALLAAHFLPTSPSMFTLGIIWPESLKFLGSLLFIIGGSLALLALLKLFPNLSPLPDPKPGSGRGPGPGERQGQGPAPEP